MANTKYPDFVDHESAGRDEPPARNWEATKATPGETPFMAGLIGPPGGGKTWSALRLGRGMQRVRKGPLVLIDTECGRSRKYASDFDFLRVDFDPPFSSKTFLEAVRYQLKLNPAAIIVDTMSDEHDGDGGYMKLHDAMVPKSGGNKHAAWNLPQEYRGELIRGLQRIRVPLLLCFRAKEKTKQIEVNGKKVVVQMGWGPVTGDRVLHGLDLACILPPRSDGVPVWQSDKVGEDFIIKLPNYLKPFIRDKQQLSEDLGEAFALWASGKNPTAFAGEAPSRETDADLEAGRAAATNGMEFLKEWWSTLPKGAQERLKQTLEEKLKPAAAAADARPHVSFE
jgi:hypothetical protein